MADVGIKISAFDNTKTAFDSVGRNLGNIQASAASVAGALASIGVGISVGGFVAMTKQIIDGLDAMNDLKDATGASIENISALEDVARRTGSSFDTVSTALIKLNQGLNNAKAGSDTEAAIKAIGLSVKDLKALDPAEAFQRIAVGLSGFADDGNKARIVQELFGKSLKEVAPLLKDLAESGGLNATVTTAQAEAAEKLNKQIFSLQKNALDLGRAFTSTLIPAISDGVERFILAHKHAGSLLDTLALYGRLDYGKNIQGNLGDVEKQIAALEQRATRITSAGAMAGNDKMIADLKAQAAYLKELRITKVLADQGDNSDAVSRRYMTPKASIGDFDQTAAKAAAAAAAKALAEYNRELEKQSKLIAESAGLTGSFAEDWDRLTKIYEKGSYNLDQLTEAQAKLLAGQPGIKAYNDADVKAAEAIEKARVSAADARQKYNAGLDADLAKLQDESAAMQDYVDRLGLSKEAVAELDAQRLESQAVTQDLIVLKKIEQGLDADQYEIYVKMAAELRSQAALKRATAGKESTLEAGKESAKATFDEWKRGWEETDRLGREVWTDMTTQGENAAEKVGKAFRTTVSSALYDVFAKPYLLQVYTSIAGGAPGALGAAGSAGSAANGAGLLGGAGSLFGAGFKAGFGSVFGEAGTMGGLSAGTTAIGAGNVAGGLGTLAGTAMPYLIAASVVKSLTDYKIDAKGNALTATIGSSGVTNGQVGTRADFTQSSSGFLSGGNTNNSTWGVADQSVADYITGSVKSITAANKAYGDSLGLTSAAIDGFTKNLDISITGLDAAGQKAAIDAELVKFAAEQSTAAYGTAIAAFAKDGEIASATVARLATDLTSVNTAFGALGFSLFDMSVAGAAAASGLVDAMGGLQNFQTQTTSYFQNYYTAEEQRAQTIKNINAATIGSTLDAATATRDSFRSLVEAQDLTTDSGRKMYASLLSVADAFAGITNTAASAASAVQSQSLQLGGNAAGGGWTVDNAGNIIGGANAAAVDSRVDPGWQRTLASLWTGGFQATSMGTPDNAAALEADKALADAATEAAKALAGFQSALGNLTDTNIGLQAKMLELQGDTAGAYALTRKRDLDKLTAGFTGDQASQLTAQYDANKTLADQIDALTQSQSDAAKATADAASAADRLKSAWAGITDSMIKEVDRIRGVVSASSSDNYGALAARFTIGTAQARAGDQTAAGNLTGYASQLSDSVSANAGSRNELIRMQAQIAQSLETTAAVLGAPMAPTLAPPVINTDKLEASIATLSAEIVSLKGELSAIKSNTRRTADAVNGAGESPMVVEIDT